MAKIARILKTDVMGDLSALAQILQSKGRGKDKILAHITPEEAKRLKRAGGRGSKNPDTGLLEFDDGLPEPTGPVPQPIDVSGPPSYASTQLEPVSVPQGADLPSAPIMPQEVSMPLSQIGAPNPVSAQFSPYAARPSTVDVSGGAAIQPNLISPLGDVQAGLTSAGTPSSGPDQSTFDKIVQSLGGTQGLARLGIAGAGGLANILQTRKAQNQIAAAQQDEKALAQPYQTQGYGMMGAAARGELTPASAQAYQAAQAQMQQQAAARGGVGVEQQAAQLEALRQQLLIQQYNYGLQVAQIGDQVALGAIRTGLQLDQQLGQANQAFYTNLMAVAGGISPRTQGTVV